MKRGLTPVDVLHAIRGYLLYVGSSAAPREVPSVGPRWELELTAVWPL